MIEDVQHVAGAAPSPCVHDPGGPAVHRLMSGAGTTAAGLVGQDVRGHALAL